MKKSDFWIMAAGSIIPGKNCVDHDDGILVDHLAIILASHSEPVAIPCDFIDRKVVAVLKGNTLLAAQKASRNVIAHFRNGIENEQINSLDSLGARVISDNEFEKLFDAALIFESKHSIVFFENLISIVKQEIEGQIAEFFDRQVASSRKYLGHFWADQFGLTTLTLSVIVPSEDRGGENTFSALLWSIHEISEFCRIKDEGGRSLEKSENRFRASTVTTEKKNLSSD